MLSWRTHQSHHAAVHRRKSTVPAAGRARRPDVPTYQTAVPYHVSTIQYMSDAQCHYSLFCTNTVHWGLYASAAHAASSSPPPLPDSLPMVALRESRSVLMEPHAQAGEKVPTDGQRARPSSQPSWAASSRHAPNLKLTHPRTHSPAPLRPRPYDTLSPTLSATLCATLCATLSTPRSASNSQPPQYVSQYTSQYMSQYMSQYV
eukprot:CAMPEP_0181217004 /NCGR_PEP_ID=MMETSP1096-20121128/26904_1 /TAXON_ID=156174 ORGANISM="Chrysochromulina ericina, Strain CCMP281" /NCGR_SAMPLE_ID=MMETSP1096 /ASSEMBLY_ACC=CAM_ASM_000453 /LENGTH=203 /DNA_ID=CAMNT_0023309075 /DNA_START=45 /DNA_END=655 /DNA_ORIENTATION=-